MQPSKERVDAAASRLSKSGDFKIVLDYLVGSSIVDLLASDVATDDANIRLRRHNTIVEVRDRVLEAGNTGELD